jgi:hypothetical protein
LRSTFVITVQTSLFFFSQCDFFWRKIN